jgi:hypothetical protein
MAFTLSVFLHVSKESSVFETSGNANPVTQRHILRDQNSQSHCCEASNFEILNYVNKYTKTVPLAKTTETTEKF